jgi:hypothetical protein
MRLELRFSDFHIDLQLRQTIERRIRFSLGRFASLITQASVRLAKVGEERLSCRIVVNLRRAGRIAVEDADRDLMDLIRQTSDRIGESVRRELDRQREQAETDRKLIKK